MSSNKILLCGAVSGLSFVVFGAIAAHALKASIDESMLPALHTGLRYHAIHSVALIALVPLSMLRAHRVWAFSAILMMAGIMLFSGSLYGLALGGPLWLGPVTPLGGLSLILAWCCLIYGSLKVKL